MSDFYSLIYIKPNVLTDELMLVGMLANMNGNPSVYFSDDRLKFIKKLMKKNQSKALVKFIHLINNEVDELTKVPDSLPLFDHPYSQSIVQITAVYKKNFLVLSGPSEIADASKLSFEKLVRTIFNEKLSSRAEKVKTISFRSLWLQELRVIKHSMRRKFSLSPELITTIFSPHMVDLIGIYEDRIHCFHSIDFKSAPRTVGKNLYEFSRLFDGLEEFSSQNGLQKGQYVLVYEKPANKNGKEMLEKALVDANSPFELLEFKNFRKEIMDMKYQGENTVETILRHG